MEWLTVLIQKHVLRFLFPSFFVMTLTLIIVVNHHLTFHSFLSPVEYTFGSQTRSAVVSPRLQVAAPSNTTLDDHAHSNITTPSNTTAFPTSTDPSNSTNPSNTTRPNESGHIPNIVHYVYLLPDTARTFSFQFKHLLSIYASYMYLNPTTIYLHTNANAHAIDEARSSNANKWNRLLLDIPTLRINRVESPTHAANGKALANIEHKSDFVRTAVVSEMGGLYLDFDAHPLRDVKVLRESGFSAIFGRQHKGEVNNGVFLAKPGALLLDVWKREMNRVYDGRWSTHGNGVLTKICPRLMRNPGEVLILEQDALQPGSWEPRDTANLFAVHSETRSNLEGKKNGDVLEDFVDTDVQGLRKRGERWERDYSSTFVLHAFDPSRNGKAIEGFKHVTPRYVLERRSNFARAVYPVAKRLYELQLLSWNDTHLGD
ncbi:hypothetical protein OQA88_12569 [Cercophora sp. LCS_1]